MPRLVNERLVGYTPRLHREQYEVPRTEVTADGGDLTTAPETVEVTVLTFVDQRAGRSIEIPFTDEQRQALIQALTGGIVIP